MKKLFIILFVLVALVQLYVPVQMIFEREKVISEGEAFKFITAPVDPSDPFRGKYIDLQFEANEFKLRKTSPKFKILQKVFVQLEHDDRGFAAIKNITIDAPDDDVKYVKATVQQLMPYENPETIVVRYPFERFYMEESKAYDAELTYRNSLSDTASTTYAQVYVKDGNSVIMEVFIDDVPILELLRQNENLSN